MDDGQTDKIILFYLYVLNQQVEHENRSLIRDFNQLFRYVEPSVTPINSKCL